MNCTAACVGVATAVGSEGPNVTKTGGVLLLLMLLCVCVCVRACARVVVCRDSDCCCTVRVAQFVGP